MNYLNCTFIFLIDIVLWMVINIYFTYQVRKRKQNREAHEVMPVPETVVTTLPPLEATGTGSLQTAMRSGRNPKAEPKMPTPVETELAVGQW